MAGRQYSTGVSPDYHSKLMESSDAREARRAAQLAKLPIFIGQSLRGRMREGIESVHTPTVLPKSLAETLGKVLRNKNEVLRDQFTDQLPTLRDKQLYHRYVLGGNKNNRRHETDPVEREQARLARKRQTQHVADNLHKNTWIQWQVARLYKAGTEHVRTAKLRGLEPNEDALLVTASAIEDFGYCLDEKPILRKVAHSHFVPQRLIQIGQYGAMHPSSLLAQEPVTLLLVQREQERREELWGGNLEFYEDPELGGYRRTSQDEQDEQANDLLIDSWQL